MLLAPKEQVYIRELATIKRYRNKYKLTYHKTLRIPGFEEQKPQGDKEHEHYNTKLSESLSRSRARVFELAMCNDFDYFITCTLDPDKYQRNDLEKFRKDLTRFIRNQRAKWNSDISYILIPELHADGTSWHMHGLLGGVKKKMLEDFIAGVHPQKLIEGGYKNWRDYQRKFGFVSLGSIRSREGVSKYITKYVTKAMSRGVQELSKNIYYTSQGLKRAEEIKRGCLNHTPESWEFINDYVSIIWIEEHEVNTYID